MFDGITITARIVNFVAWKRSAKISFDTNTDIDTGEVSTKKRNEKMTTTYRATWETFRLIVKEVENITTGKKKFHLTIKGSLHKNYYSGKNYLPFTWEQLQHQVKHLCKSLCINPTRAQISNLEVGLNLPVPFEVTPFLKQSIINYKGYRFSDYKKDSAGFCLGIHCDKPAQYEIKIYDKGLQNDLPYPLMRFEKRFTKMQALNNAGIKFLSDLQQRPKVKGLSKMLLDAWENTLLYDPTINLDHPALKPKESKLLLNGSNQVFWETLKKTDPENFKYERKKFRNLVRKYGNDQHKKVKELIQTEWEALFKNSPNLQDGEDTGVTGKFPDLTIKVKGKIGEKGFCLSCGRDISNQKEGSKFCSARYVGEVAAKRCRNSNSNPRNHFKQKMEREERWGLLFDLLPFMVERKPQDSQLKGMRGGR